MTRLRTRAFSGVLAGLTLALIAGLTPANAAGSPTGESPQVVIATNVPAPAAEVVRPPAAKSVTASAASTRDCHSIYYDGRRARPSAIKLACTDGSVVTAKRVGGKTFRPGHRYWLYEPGNPGAKPQIKLKFNTSHHHAAHRITAITFTHGHVVRVYYGPVYQFTVSDSRAKRDLDKPVYTTTRARLVDWPWSGY